MVFLIGYYKLTTSFGTLLTDSPVKKYSKLHKKREDGNDSIQQDCL